MNKGLQYACEFLLGAALGFFYFAIMVQAPKSAFIEPFFESNIIVLYFGVPMIASVLLFVYSRFQVFAVMSFAASIAAYFIMPSFL